MAGTPSLWEFVPRGDAGISVGEQEALKKAWRLHFSWWVGPGFSEETIWVAQASTHLSSQGWLEVLDRRQQATRPWESPSFLSPSSWELLAAMLLLGLIVHLCIFSSPEDTSPWIKAHPNPVRPHRDLINYTCKDRRRSHSQSPGGRDV